MNSLKTIVDLMAGYMAGKWYDSSMSTTEEEDRHNLTFPYNILETLFNLPEGMLYEMSSFTTMVADKLSENYLVESVIAQNNYFEVRYKAFN